MFGATYDPSPIMNTNANGFVSVITQYRLGAFGFLSSDEVHRYGKVNAGLLDQSFALEWVQNHIEKFGGDPKRVTIGGESAGAGSVMLHAMAYGGKQNVTLFDNVSPHAAHEDLSVENLLAYSREPVSAAAIQLQRSRLNAKISGLC